MTNSENTCALNSIYLNPTRFCNLACSHCWLSPPVNDELVESADELTIDQMNAIVRSARKVGLSAVKLTGGEPLLRKDIGEFIRECHRTGISITMETNGTLIDDSMADLLAECEVEHVSISLDSFDGNVHDRLRGKKGAFVGAINGVRRLIDRKLPAQVILSLYKENLGAFQKFLDLMTLLKVRDVKINTITPLGRASSLYESGSVPTVEEVVKFSDELDGMRGEFDGSIYMDIPPAFKTVETLKTGTGCASCAIKGILGVLSDGRVSICGIGYMDEEMIFGDLKDDPDKIIDIWKNEPLLKAIRDDMPEKFEGICGKCVMRGICMGSCRAEVYHNTGSLMSPYWFCQEAYDKGFFPETRIMPDAAKV